MKRILITVAVIGVAAAIALSTQSYLPRATEVTDTLEAVAPVSPPTQSAPVADSLSTATDTAVSAAQERSDAPAPVPAPAKDVQTAATAPPAEASANEQQDGAAILTRAAAAYAAARTLQADFTMTLNNPLLRSNTTSRGTLFQRSPDRILLRFTEPAGDVIVSDGQYFWIYYPSVNDDQVIRAPASAAGAGGVDLQAQFLGDPVRRFTHTLHGRDTVSGRETNVLTLVPREDLGYTRLKVWLDTRDHLARRFEITEPNGAVRRFDLSNLRANPQLQDALFRFTPPAGARVIDRG